jgi:hypothetical protein
MSDDNSIITDGEVIKMLLRDSIRLIGNWNLEGNNRGRIEYSGTVTKTS